MSQNGSLDEGLISVARRRAEIAAADACGSGASHDLLLALSHLRVARDQGGSTWLVRAIRQLMERSRIQLCMLDLVDDQELDRLERVAFVRLAKHNLQLAKKYGAEDGSFYADAAKEIITKLKIAPEEIRAFAE